MHQMQQTQDIQSLGKLSLWMKMEIQFQVYHQLLTMNDPNDATKMIATTRRFQAFLATVKAIPITIKSR